MSLMRANAAWDWVDGPFGEGVTMVYTVTDELGTVKGGATVTAGSDSMWVGAGCWEKMGDCDMVPGDL